MGWLWASSSPHKPSSPAQDTSSSQKTTPDDPNVDPEVQKFLEFFASDTKPKQDTSKPTTNPQPSSAKPNTPSTESSSSWFSLKASRDRMDDPSLGHAPPRDALSETLLPTEMSCRQAFDLAWACNSLGGQWNAVYRHGEMRSCSDQWDDFWFCMRTKSFSGPARAEAVREHYRDREYRKYYAPGARSSEDVWSPRDGRLPPGSAFSQPIDAPVVSDDEWRKEENDRRRKVRQSLGLEDKVDG